MYSKTNNLTINFCHWPLYLGSSTIYTTITKREFHAYLSDTGKNSYIHVSIRVSVYLECTVNLTCLYENVNKRIFTESDSVRVMSYEHVPLSREN